MIARKAFCRILHLTSRVIDFFDILVIYQTHRDKISVAASQWEKLPGAMSNGAPPLWIVHTLDRHGPSW